MKKVLVVLFMVVAMNALAATKDDVFCIVIAELYKYGVVVGFHNLPPDSSFELVKNQVDNPEFFNLFREIYDTGVNRGKTHRKDKSIVEEDMLKRELVTGFLVCEKIKAN